MQLLYDYLTSSEFSEQWKAIREGFSSTKMSIQRERDTMGESYGRPGKNNSKKCCLMLRTYQGIDGRYFGSGRI